MKTESSFRSADGRSNIHYEVWKPEKEPVCVLQIIHGMSEYVGRYAAFAEFLNSYGVLVCGEDHIGHGHSAEPKDYGYMGKGGGWENIVEDVHTLRGMMQKDYPGIPYVMMGHSMGSFLIRAYLQKHQEGLAAAIIMGTGGKNPAAGAGLFITKLVRKLKGDYHRSAFLTKTAFGSYLDRIPDARTNNDWLSRDTAVVDAYIADPMCGFVFTTSGYQELMEVLIQINTKEWYASIAKDLPIMVIAGAEDPVGAYGAGPKEVADGLKAAGCKDVQLKLYDGMRHEILNEIGKEQVMYDLKDFIFEKAVK